MHLATAFLIILSMHKIIADNDIMQKKMACDIKVQYIHSSMNLVAANSSFVLPGTPQGPPVLTLSKKS